ncbi:MAG: hypothetical protein M3Z00_08040, partial [Actinomycetota bacterium]|nr:hypothetical protein [Actinomycetota bacterium]
TAPALRASSSRRCLWCGRALADGNSVGRKRRYCGQSCRQRAYESRAALDRGGLPADAVVLTGDEREALSDRLFQVRGAAEDVATALADGATPAELSSLVDDLVGFAKDAEVLH